MALLMQTGKYGAINSGDTTTIGYYGTKYISYTFILEEDIPNDRKLIKASEKADIA